VASVVAEIETHHGSSPARHNSAQPGHEERDVGGSGREHSEEGEHKGQGDDCVDDQHAGCVARVNALVLEVLQHALYSWLAKP